MREDRSSRRAEQLGAILVIAVWCGLCATALWQLARASLWGVIAGIRRSGAITLESSSLLFWMTVSVWGLVAFATIGFAVGIAVFMWIQRNDKL